MVVHGSKAWWDIRDHAGRFPTQPCNDSLSRQKVKAREGRDVAWAEQDAVLCVCVRAGLAKEIKERIAGGCLPEGQ